MSMTGSVGEETCLEPPCSEASRRPPFSDATQRPTRQGCCAVSPLLRVFSSKEIVPKILDYEKALLVMKEHDYSKAGERPGVAKLSSLLTEPPCLGEGKERATATQAAALDSSPVLPDLSALLRTRKDLLLVRESAFRKDDSVVTDHLREVVGMQIELIREQQEQLHDKDKELNTVRKDKEQLQARMERMERRLAILQKRSKNETSESEAFQNAENSEMVVTTPRIRTHRDVVADSEKYSRSRSNSHDRVGRAGRQSRISSKSGTPVPQDLQEPPSGGGSGSGKRSAKRKLSDNIGLETVTRKRRSRQNDMRTMYEYGGLNLLHQVDGYVLPPSSLDRLSHHWKRTNNGDLSNSVASPSTSSHSEGGEKVLTNGVANATILVPSWRASLVRSLQEEAEAEFCEDLSDEAFNKRHRKPEDDEKKRKRWDVQRMRAIRNHEELLRKYNQKGGGDRLEKKKEKMTTFLPKPSEVETIEIKDTVPVTAFGVPLPSMKPKEFELSWFDLDARETKDNLK